MDVQYQVLRLFESTCYIYYNFSGLSFALARRLLGGGPKVFKGGLTREALVWRALGILYSEKAHLIDWIIKRFWIRTQFMQSTVVSFTFPFQLRMADVK